ncbi:MAG: carbamoyltransferase HypF [Planctomycetota bacterium]
MSASSPVDAGGWYLLQGSVQGCGLRPAVADYASRQRIGGWVCNTESGVVLHLQTDAAARQQLIDWLISRFCGSATPLPPPDFLATVHPACPDPPSLEPFFRILDVSMLTSAEREWLEGVCVRLPRRLCPGPGVPRDLAICEDCRLEVRDSSHRRGDYVLNSCVRCGPRYSVLSVMPWDRDHTSLSLWRVCDRCREEYELLPERRGHAQLISCRGCGPRLWLRRRLSESSSANGTADFQLETAETVEDEQRLLHEVVECLAGGGLIALLGMGGWQLVCDACNSQAVLRLRQLKQRPWKPLAVMIPAAEFLRPAREGPEAVLLRSSENPILVCEAELSPPLAPEISGSLRSCGVFLPTTALHDWLLQRLQRPLAVSSGNLEGDPILYESDAVPGEPGDGVDLLLGHQRRILRPIDDSVVRVIAGRPAVLRLGRGFAPFPLPLVVDSPGAIVALGGHQKSSFAIAGNGRAVLGPHCGDLHSEASRERFLQQLTATLDLYRLTPAVFVHDMHPDYFTTIWARSQRLPTIAVQHHHAHAAAALLDARIDGPVLAVTFDGTGYSADGVIRGGEFLIARRSRCQPVASLLTFQLPGAELAARSPWRSAVAVLEAALPGWDADRIARWIAGRPAAHQCGPAPSAAAIDQFQRAVTSRAGPVCSSMGRFFDAMACLILGVHTAGWEGAAAMQLEDDASILFRAVDRDLWSEVDVLSELLPILETDPLTLDWRPLVRAVMAGAEQGRTVQELARIVHLAIVGGVLRVACRFPHMPVVLTGGCFQNRVLSECAAEVLECAGFRCVLPGLIPVNDGGLAAGQLAVAAAIIESGEWQMPECGGLPVCQ